ENLDHYLAIDLRDALQNVVADGLREARLETGYRFERLLKLRQQLLLGDLALPLLLRRQVDQEFGHIDLLRVRAVLRASRLGYHRADFGELSQYVAHARAFLHRLSYGDSGWKREIHPYGAFIELGEKLAA